MSDRQPPATQSWFDGWLEPIRTAPYAGMPQAERERRLREARAATETPSAPRECGGTRIEIEISF
jgi:hypothetical protein